MPRSSEAFSSRTRDLINSGLLSSQFKVSTRKVVCIMRGWWKFSPYQGDRRKAYDLTDVSASTRGWDIGRLERFGEHSNGMVL
jgi:hypothetical protein